MTGLYHPFSSADDFFQTFDKEVRQPSAEDKEINSEAAKRCMTVIVECLIRSNENIYKEEMQRWRNSIESLKRAKLDRMFSETEHFINLASRLRTGNEPVYGRLEKSVADQGVRKHDAPPKSAQFVLHCLLSLESQDGIVGDLKERFAARVREYGLGRAQRWYWYQAISLVPHAIWQRWGGLLKWVGGGCAGLEILRRLFGG